MARKTTRARGRPSEPAAAGKDRSIASLAAVTSSELGIKQQIVWTLPIASIYALIGTWGHFDFSPLMGYYNMLADAFLAGNLHIAITPDEYYLHDMIPYEGKYYLQWGPVPALFHLACKLVGFTLTDRVACMLTGWVSSLVFLSILMRVRGRFFPETDLGAYRWLLYAFALATPTAMVSLRGSVYHESIAFGGLFILLAFWGVLRYLEEPIWKWALLAGVAIGLAAGCRVSLVLYGLAPGLLIIAYFWMRKVEIRSALVHVGLLSLPVVVSGLLQMGYNDARFGSPFDYGNGYLPDATGQAAFSLTYVWENIAQYVLALPEISADFPWIAHNGWQPIEHLTRTEDMSSTLLMSPFVLLSLACLRLTRGDNDQLRLFAASAVGSSGLMLLVMLCFAAASRRYMQDFMPVMMIASGVGLGYIAQRGPRLWRKWRVVGWAVVIVTASLHAQLSFAQGFVWEPPDPNVVKTFVAWTPSVLRFLPGPKLAEQAAMAGNDLGTLYLRQGRVKDAYEEFEQAAQLMPESPLIRRNLEIARRRLPRGP